MCSGGVPRATQVVWMGVCDGVAGVPSQGLVCGVPVAVVVGGGGCMSVAVGGDDSGGGQSRLGETQGSAYRGIRTSASSPDPRDQVQAAHLMMVMMMQEGPQGRRGGRTGPQRSTMAFPFETGWGLHQSLVASRGRAAHQLLPSVPMGSLALHSAPLFVLIVSSFFSLFPAFTPGLSLELLRSLAFSAPFSPHLEASCSQKLGEPWRLGFPVC